MIIMGHEKYTKPGLLYYYVFCKFFNVERNLILRAAKLNQHIILKGILTSTFESKVCYFGKWDLSLFSQKMGTSEFLPG